MKKVLITGCSGMLGNVLADEFYLKGQSILGVDLRKPNNDIPFTKLDLTQSLATISLLEVIHPEIIIHTAAYTDVDFCERNPEITNKLHIEATKLLSDYSNSRAKLVFISSDSVFEGTLGNYKEDDNKNPINYYARSKDIAEEIIKTSCDDYLIVRTNIFGFHQNHGKSLVEWALSKLTTGQKINGFVDVRFNAIYTRFLSRILLNMIELDLKGTYHVCSSNSLSKFEFLTKLATIFKLNVDLISPMKVVEFCLQTNRPNNTTLNVEKIHSLIELPSIEDGLFELYADYSKFKLLNI